MLSNNISFRKGFIDSFKAYSDIEKNNALVDTLIKLLDQETLKDFAHTLESDCSLSVEDICLIAEELMMKKDCNYYLGTKIILLWLEFEIYMLLKIEY